MATDAQRLIAVSLGKIATGRGHKGGIDLHKNLLVAGVLHKARTVIMIENYQVVMQSRVRQVGVQNNYQQRELQSVPNPTPSEGHLNQPATPIAPDSPNPGQVAKRLAGNSESNSQDFTAKSQHIDTSDKENSSPNGQSDQLCSKKLDTNSQSVGILDNKSDTQNPRGQSQCLRCVKRRYTDNASSDKQEDNSVKRPKTEEKSEENTGPEPMQTETQITNLVACFNTGFSGLLNHIGSSESDNNNTSTSSDGHITSCATEMKAGFSSIPTPVLALSV